jgi:hypothetical protein
MTGSTGRSPVSVVVVVVVVVGCGAASQRLSRAAHSLSLQPARSLHVTQIKQILRFKVRLVKRCVADKRIKRFNFIPVCCD